MAASDEQAKIRRQRKPPDEGMPPALLHTTAAATHCGVDDGLLPSPAQRVPLALLNRRQRRALLQDAPCAHAPSAGAAA